MFKFLKRLLIFSLIIVIAGGIWGYRNGMPLKRLATFFDGQQGRFRLSYVPVIAGDLKIGLQHEESGQSFEIVLVYEVKGKSAPI